jgi:hypothetical protein
MRRAQYIVASERWLAAKAVSNAEELIERLKRKEREQASKAPRREPRR